ncbi:hypothetical protein QYF36_000016 [Acer negundo]|nr:hypothetical protein QYF36_000016 [Acer negundo]
MPFQIETDSIQVVDLVSKGEASFVDVGSIIIDILVSFELILECSILHVPRKGNIVAHSLAKEAISTILDSCWLDICPPCVERLVLLDAHIKVSLLSLNN